MTQRAALLLATYNGAAFLSAQLDSIARQTHRDWRVYASDDHSSDDTRRVLEDYRSQWGGDKMTVCNGPRQGGTTNFLSLALRPDIVADAYFFADQDDVWHEDKIARAMAALAQAPAGHPALYMSSTLLVDVHDTLIGPSKVFTGAPGFSNALVQNMAAGNTMAFNDALARQLRLIGRVDVPYHDWWVYLVATALDAVISYDPVPSLRYRQHAQNALGENRTLPAIKKRAAMIRTGVYQRYNDKNIAALQALVPLLSVDKHAMLAQFNAMRCGPALSRWLAFLRSPLRRHGRLDNLVLSAACLLKKV